ncbi:hypothetical protein Lal_00017872 [Lupinus albus]|nr:hypothetical protein Lal_00017872 [Lupinus albus]
MYRCITLKRAMMRERLPLIKVKEIEREAVARDGEEMEDDEEAIVIGVGSSTGFLERTSDPPPHPSSTATSSRPFSGTDQVKTKEEQKMQKLDGFQGEVLASLYNVVVVPLTHAPVYVGCFKMKFVKKALGSTSLHEHNPYEREKRLPGLFRSVERALEKKTVRQDSWMKKEEKKSTEILHDC